MPTPKTACVLLATLLLASGSLAADEDHTLEIDADGTISGLPAEYRPAQLLADFGTGISLRIGSTRTSIPACVRHLIRTREKTSVQVTGSWGNKNPQVTNFIDVAFFDPGYDRQKWANPGVAFIFNLDSGKLMEVKRMAVADGAFSEEAVDLVSLCSKAELAELFGGPG